MASEKQGQMPNEAVIYTSAIEGPSRVHENQSVQLGAFSTMGVCHGGLP